MTEKNPNVELFLKRLEELTRETGLIIGSCGCCESPYLYHRGNKTFQNVAEYVRFDRKEGTYSADIREDDDTE